jgi:hypothetical protein
MPSVRYPINLDATIEGGFDSRFNSAATPDIFHSASEICNITLVPGDNTTVAAKSTSNHGTEQSVFGSPAVPTSSPTVVSGRITGNAAYAAAATWWNNFTMTGDNERESPYNQIYPRLTTKSNTYCVHMRVQTLIKSNLSAPGTFDESKGDAVTGEYRGSAIVERYIDPNDTSMNGVDFTSPGTSLDQYYKFRVVSTKAFTPQ